MLNRPFLISTDSETELEQIWDERKEKYLEAADITFDVSGESLGRTSDITAKTNQIIALVKQKTVL